MRIADALTIGELSTGTVIAGRKGITREIVSIEVMEVPEVGSWITEGILMMTTFYSVKDDYKQQFEILKTLIEKDASGMVIKLGRFVKQIPKEMIELADANSFPIISIPKNVSYINVLTPLYEKLYEEKKKVTKDSLNPFHAFIKEDYATVSEAIETLSKILESQVYVEDCEGRLLYCTDKISSDGWRNTKLLLSNPIHPRYKELLKEWRIELQRHTLKRVKFSDQRNRLIVPLISKNNIFAFIHLPYKNQTKFNKIESQDIDSLIRKLSETIMNEQLELQKERMKDIATLESLLDHHNSMNTNSVFTILFFTRKYLKGPFFQPSTLMDSKILIRKKIKELVEDLPFEQNIIFEKNNHFFAIVQYSLPHNQNMLAQLIEVFQPTILDSSIEDMHISISPPFQDLKDFDDKIKSSTKIMEIGLKVRPDEKVYAYDKLGIYEILINLSTDPFAVKYTEEVLQPLASTDGQLLETLIAFLNENGNVSRTAEKLFIHRRTMTYRLQKIKELINMELDDPENLFILRFCLKIKELR
ncbi:PucR family transcriptional regulator [Pseudalkalibacillus decolorationis]|uniref:PucR family transcriptional regulator n=1 Tax=Pseudalkalibacillus decolorationis TaxID=163879 RepID=UPI0021491399|nr:PucR family transcriptional regulator [Pseudalkalibacillus decolorationis]